jgi:hypothetical protein
LGELVTFNYNWLYGSSLTQNNRSTKPIPGLRMHEFVLEEKINGRSVCILIIDTNCRSKFSSYVGE